MIIPFRSHCSGPLFPVSQTICVGRYKKHRKTDHTSYYSIAFKRKECYTQNVQYYIPYNTVLPIWHNKECFCKRAGQGAKGHGGWYIRKDFLISRGAKHGDLYALYNHCT